jgi:hypothetical protein
MPVPAADPAGALLRHFTDLRDRTHGGASSRREKEELFGKAVALIDPYARRALDEINQDLLLGTGEVTATDVRPQAAGGTEAEWTLTWPLQQAAGIAPVTLRAQVAWAERVLSAARAGGAVAGGGQMIDAPLIRQAESILGSAR